MTAVAEAVAVSVVAVVQQTKPRTQAALQIVSSYNLQTTNRLALSWGTTSQSQSRTHAMEHSWGAGAGSWVRQQWQDEMEAADVRVEAQFLFGCQLLLLLLP